MRDPLVVRAMDVLLDPMVLVTAVRDQGGSIVDFEYLHANEAACSYNRLSYDELVGARLLDLLPEHVASGLFAQYARVVDTGEPLVLDEIEYDHELRGGAHGYYDIRAVRVGDGLSFTWRDVTERHEYNSARAASERRYRLIAENAADVVFVLGPDRALSWVSPSGARVLGRGPGDLVGHPVEQYVHPQDRDSWLTSGSDPHGGVGRSGRMRVQDGTGGWRWVQWHRTTLRDAQGQLLEAVGVLSDISDLVAAEEQVAAARAERDLTLLSMDAAVTGVALVGPDLRFRYVNQAMCDLLGYTSKGLLGKSFLDVTDPDDRDRGRQAAHEVLVGARDSFTQRKRFQTASGGVVWVDLFVSAVHGPDGEFVHSVAQVVDVSREVASTQQLVDQAAHLQHVATHDGLTGLVNRAVLLERLGRVLGHPARADSCTAVLFVDVDRLKAVNDTYGHAAGDELLTAVAARMRCAVREQDVVARVGGDEFVVLLTSLRGPEDATAVAAKVRAAVGRPLRVHSARTPATPSEVDVDVSVSIGIALAEAGQDADEVLRKADAALYAVKENRGSGPAWSPAPPPRP